jgi:hypothetical protein
VAVIEGLAGDFSYDLVKRLYYAVVRHPLHRRRLAAEIERRVGVPMHRWRLMRALATEKAFSLLLAGDPGGLGELLGPSARRDVPARALGEAALGSLQELADRSTRLDLAQLEQGRSLQDGQDFLHEQVLRVLNELDRAAGPGPLARDPLAAAFRSDDLLERDDDLDLLWEQILETLEPYVVVSGAPWAGKTAMLAEIALDPPANCEVVSFFVRQVGRRNTAEHFLDVVNRQLCRLLNLREDGQDLTRRRTTFEDLWARAVADSDTKQRLLILLIDGLDEQDETAAVPISSLLPAIAGEWTRVLIATRPKPKRPRELSQSHPYVRAARRPFVLKPSQAARDIADHALEAVQRMAEGGELTRRVLGLLAVADGPLTAADLVELVECSPDCLRDSMAELERHLVGDGSITRPWELGHLELLNNARADLDRGLLEECEAAIDALADAYHASGWPPATPSYLLRPYAAMLLRRRLPRRIAWLISEHYEAQVRARLRTRRGLMDTIIGALGLYQELDAPIEDDDVTAICTLGLRLTELRATTAAIPAQVVEAWARMGDLAEADRLLNQTRNTRSLAAGIEAVIKATDAPEELFDLLVDHVGRLEDAAIRSETFVALANAYPSRAHPLLKRAEQDAANLEPPHIEVSQLLKVATALVAINPTEARELFTRAELAAERLDQEWIRDGMLAEVAKRVATADRTTQELAAHTEQIVDRISDSDARDGARVAVLTTLATANQAHAHELLERAERAAGHLTVSGDQRDQAWEAVATALATTVPDIPGHAARARRAVERIDDAWIRSRAFIAMAIAAPSWAPEFLVGAEGAADQIEHASDQGRALAAVVEARVTAYTENPAQAALARQVAERIAAPAARCQALTAIAVAASGPARSPAGELLELAIEAAECIDDPWERDRGFEAVANAQVTIDPTDLVLVTKAELVAERIEAPECKCRTLGEMAAVLAPIDPLRTRKLLGRAEQVAERIRSPWTSQAALVAMATPVVSDSPALTQRLLARAEQLSEDIQDSEHKSQTVTAIATAAAPADPVHALELLGRAQQIAEGIQDSLHAKDRALHAVAAALATLGPTTPEALAQAEHIAERIHDPECQTHALVALAKTHPSRALEQLSRAQQIAEGIQHPWPRGMALLAIASALISANASVARGLLQQAEEVAERIDDPSHRSRLLVAIAWTLARIDPARGAHLLVEAQRAVTDPDARLGRNEALLAVATMLTDISARTEAWAVLARVAMPEGLPADVMPALVRLGGEPAQRAIARRVLGVADEPNVVVSPT